MDVGDYNGGPCLNQFFTASCVDVYKAGMCEVFNNGVCFRDLVGFDRFKEVDDEPVFLAIFERICEVVSSHLLVILYNHKIHKP